MTHKILCFLVLLHFSETTFGFNYLTEVPVKLLDVKSHALVYPAANSDFRKSIVNGQVSGTLYVHRAQTQKSILSKLLSQ